MLRRYCAWVRSHPAWLRIPVFVIPFLLLWLLLDSGFGLPDWVSTLVLYLIVVSAFGGWGRWVHGHVYPYRALGLSLSQGFRQEVAIGLICGVAGVFIPLLLEGWLGWLEWTSMAPKAFLTALANAVATAAAVGFAEELLFRGWLFEELRCDYKGWLAGVVTTAVFTAVHQWGAQTFGLILVGTILVRAKVLTGECLGLPIGLHAGWVFAISLVNIAGLLSYTSAVPSWVTGVGDNLLAGIVGWWILLLTWAGIEYWFCWRKKIRYVC
ncbi:MAG: lysostaphin resistance A-like protein [Synechococcus sp.]